MGEQMNNKDKFIAEKLGLKWHEQEDFDIFYKVKKDRPCPSCGSQHAINWLNAIKINNKQQGNPDFESEAGRVQLLKLMKKKHPKTEYGDLSYFMEDDTGEFRNFIFRLLGGEE